MIGQRVTTGVQCKNRFMQTECNANEELRARFNITVTVVATDTKRNKSCLATETMKAYMKKLQ